MEKRAAESGAGEGAAKRARVFDEVYGAGASAEVELRLEALAGERQGALKAPDVQELLLWALAEAVPAPKWFALRHRPLVARLLLVLAEGLGTDVAPLAPLLPQRAPFRAPGDRRSFADPLPLLLTCAGAAQRKNKKAKKREAARVAASGTWSVAELLLTPDQLREHAYPIAGEALRSPAHRDVPIAEFVDSAAVLAARGAEGGAGGADGAPHLLAVDCEMVRTSVGLELARLSVVDAEGRALLDELVRPARPVLDYNTRWSGLTAESLAGVTTTQEEARARLLGLMRRDTVLVGHSLENDLLALRLCHARVLDTAILFPPGRGGHGAKCALRTLAQRYLGAAIQQGSHDSTEDAATAMRLVHHKLAQPRLSPDDLAHPSLFDVLAQAAPPCAATFVGRPEALPRAQQDGGRASLIGCLTDDAVVAAALRQLASHANAPSPARLVIAHLSDLARAHAAAVRQVDAGEAPVSDCSAARGATRGRIEQLWAGAPRDTLVVVLTMHGPPAPLRDALVRRKRAEGEEAIKAADAAVESAAQEARSGMMLLAVKR